MATINPITYRGYYKDWELGLYYLQSRYYCPSLRRFISADVFMDTAQGVLGTNMFAYCLNNPINYWDPHGTFAIRAVGSWISNAFQLMNEIPIPDLSDTVVDPSYSAWRHNAPQGQREAWQANPPEVSVNTRYLTYAETDDFLSELARAESRSNNALVAGVALVFVPVAPIAAAAAPAGLAGAVGVGVGLGGVGAGYGAGRLTDRFDPTGLGAAQNRIRALRDSTTNTGVRITYEQRGRTTIITDIQPYRPSANSRVR
ncbi:MAG: RHS repeat-associated core domain-containing protein [Oscillospiraceae bacterium]|nr:RHS repeat-associated core domain-containing protein [Oscillospiraceae bacterium]